MVRCNICETVAVSRGPNCAINGNLTDVVSRLGCYVKSLVSAMNDYLLKIIRMQLILSNDYLTKQ